MAITPTPTPVSPSPLATPPPLNELGLQALQSVMGLLGLLGLNIPPIFTNLAVEQQAVSAALALGALGWAAYHRLVTAPKKIATAIAVTKASMTFKPRGSSK